MVNCPNADKLRYQLCVGLHTTRNHTGEVVNYRAWEGRGCGYTNVTYANPTGSHYTMLVICQTGKQVVSLV